MENSNISKGAIDAMKACADMYPMEHNLRAIANAYRQKALDMIQHDVRRDEFGHTPIHYLEFWERIAKLADSAYTKARYGFQKDLSQAPKSERDWKSKGDRAYDDFE